MTGQTRDCTCGDFGVRNVTVRITGGFIYVEHVQCRKSVYIDNESLMSGELPMTLTYTVDENSDEAYQVLSPAGTESAE